MNLFVVGVDWVVPVVLEGDHLGLIIEEQLDVVQEVLLVANENVKANPPSNPRHLFENHIKAFLIVELVVPEHHLIH